MRYLFLTIALLILLAGSVMADTVVVHGTECDAGSNMNNNRIHHRVTIADTTYTLDSVIVRMDAATASDDSVRFSVYRSVSPYEMVDTTNKVNTATGSGYYTLIFQLGDTVKLDTTYFMGLNGYGGANNVVGWCRDDTTLDIPTYTERSYAWDSAWQATMPSGSASTLDRMYIFTLYGTPIGDDPSGSRVIIWGVKWEDACIGCE
jgi:hypothetical protein